MQEKRLQNKKGIYTNRLTEAHWNSFWNVIPPLLLYIPATLWNFSYFILKILSETHKIKQNTSTVKKSLTSPSRNSQWNRWKNIYLKLYLSDSYTILRTFCRNFCWYIIYLQFTKI